MQPATTHVCPMPAGETEQLKELSVVLRTDLHVSRQLHQHQPVYVVHDPISFRTHRLTLQNYQILVRLDPSKKLGENFETLVRQRHFAPPDEKFYYQFVMQLHQMGLIVLPISSGSKLFDQNIRQGIARRRNKILGALFLQIPLAHPDLFLTRTASRMKWLFSQSFVAVWLVSAVVALFVVFSRMDEFFKPLNSLLATENLPFLWLSFIGLKVWHELGHGYACKVHGGAVPEMGMLLIFGTPAAYIDASAAWSFPECWKRLTVMLGGMYFESLVAIPAVFIWAFSANPMLSSCAYQLVMMASLITVLFNANPLMKYDGYFIAGELLGIQNLRGRADQFIKDRLKKWLLGLESKTTIASPRERLILCVYGVSASIYRTLLVISIAAMIAMKLPLAGLALAAFHLIKTIGASWLSLGNYLLQSRETKSIRTRAVIIAALALVVLPLSTLIIPMPFGVVAQGVVAAQTEYYLNADSPGNFAQLDVMAGDFIPAGTTLVQLENPEITDQYQVTKASLQAALLQWEVIRNQDVAESSRYEPGITELKHQLLESQRKVAGLDLMTPGAGLVARVLPKSQSGRYVKAGETVAIVVNGRPLLRTWLTEDQLGSVDRSTGSEIEFRIPGRSEKTYSGRLISIESASEHSTLSQALTILAGGEILIDPQNGQSLQPLFQIDIEPDSETVLDLSDHGMRVSLNLPRRSQSIAAWVVQRVRRFVDKTLMA